MTWEEFQPWWSGLAPTLALAIGYFGTMLTDSRRDQHARDLAASGRVAARQELADDRHREFELQYLMHANEAHRRLIELLLQHYGAAAGGTGHKVGQHDPEWEAANRTLGWSEGFILDDAVRRAVSDFRRRLVEFVKKTDTFAQTGTIDQDFADELNATLELALTARDAIAARVRLLYSEPVTRP